MLTNLDHAKNWKTTANRYVVYIDIMGFKEMVLRKRHQQVYKMMENIYYTLDTVQSIWGETKQSSNNLLMMTYSDSIIIYSKDSSIESQSNIINGTSSIYDFLISDEIPFRGAIAFGTMTLDIEKSIFFGQPLIDSYLLSEELAFYGIVVHASAEYKKGFSSNSSVCKYPCVFKNGIANHLTIVPISFCVEVDLETILIEQQTLIKRLGINSSGSIRKYIDSTSTYLDYLKTYYEEANKR